MTFIELEEYTPDQKKSKIYINPEHIVSIRNQGIYILLRLANGDEVKYAGTIASICPEIKKI